MTPEENAAILAVLRAIVDKGGPSAPVKSHTQPTSTIRGLSPWEQYTQKILPAGDEPLAQTGVLNAILGGSPRSEADFARDAAQMTGALRTIAGKVQKPIKAYHGSPHDFEQFSLSKIGTGEGAQAYGHGLYFAESPEVAKAYRDQLAGTKAVIGSDVYDSSRPDHLAASLIKTYRNSPNPTATAIKELEHDISQGVLDAPTLDRYRQTVDILKRGDALPEKSVVPAGKMYEVNIHADPEDFLDWDAPLSQQSEKVQKSVEPFLSRGNQGYRNRVTDHFIGPDPSGRQAYEAAGSYREELFKRRHVVPAGKEGATDHFQQAGIPGIKYYDGMSRDGHYWMDIKPDGSIQVLGPGRKSFGTFPDRESALAFSKQKNAESATRNYVVFDEKLIEIVKKFGIAGAISAGLINGAQAKQLEAQGYQ